MLATREGPLQVPDATVRAVARHAKRQADLTAAYLEAPGLFNGKLVQFPAAFLLELATVLELGCCSVFLVSSSAIEVPPV